MYRLHVSAKAKKELKELSKTRQLSIIEALQDIKDNPFGGRPLSRELSGRFSYRVGVYRIVYKVNKKDKVIIIITAGHRSNVYQ